MSDDEVDEKEEVVKELDEEEERKPGQKVFFKLEKLSLCCISFRTMTAAPAAVGGLGPSSNASLYGGSL